MTDQEFAQLRSESLTNTVRRLEHESVGHEQDIRQLRKDAAAAASWAIKVTRWIREHVGGHTTQVDEEIKAWTREL